MNQLLKYPRIRKFGYNPVIDLNSDPEDVWTAGAIYTWPSAAAATTIVSGSGDDDGLPAGTGAQTVFVEGCDEDFNILSETVIMNGVGAVTLANEYYRVWRAYVIAVGSGLVNAGAIDIKHGATVISQIAAGKGQTEQALYTVPIRTDRASLGIPHITGITAYPFKPASAHLDVDLFTRIPGQSWRGQLPMGIHSSSAGVNRNLYAEGVPIELSVGMDIRLTLVETSANSVGISGGFNIHWID